MALKFSMKKERVPFADGDYVEVRGLSLPDLSTLVDAHLETVTDLFNKFTGRDPNSFTNADAGTLARELVVKFPAICTHVIALAADVIDHFDDVAKLPPDVQVASLEKIATLTFQMQGGLGNFVETVLRIAKGANGLSDQIKKPRNLVNG